MSNKDGADLHYSKKSHFSVPMPMMKDVEWHFRPEDLPNKNVKMGDKGAIVIPAKVSSVDKQGIRYQQTGEMLNPVLPKGFNFKQKEQK